jgi:hypothetical protein
VVDVFPVNSSIHHLFLKVSNPAVFPSEPIYPSDMGMAILIYDGRFSFIKRLFTFGCTETFVIVQLTKGPGKFSQII